MDIDEMVSSIKRRVHVSEIDTTFDNDIKDCIIDAQTYIKYLFLGKGIKEDVIDYDNEMVIQAIKDIASSYFIVNIYPGQENQSNDFFSRGQNTLDVYLKVLNNQLKMKKILRIDTDNYTPSGSLQEE
jgi:hypothetical protein